MRAQWVWALSTAALLAASSIASAQKTGVKPVATPLEDVLLIKQKAEGGNVPAQITLAERLAANRQYADALAWYRKAAGKGAVEAEYRIGELLLHGSPAAVAEQAVPINTTEGLRRTFCAATNLHPRACRNMSLALQHGMGVRTNFIEAYAWLYLFAERNSNPGRSELNNLALRMDTRDIQQGQKLVRQFKSRQWPRLVMNQTVAIAAGLKLDGITLGGRNPLAVINRRSLEVGESAPIPVKGGTLDVKCLQIGAHAVLVEVAGEDQPRLLRFEDGLAARDGK